MTRSGKNSDKKKCDPNALALQLAQRRTTADLLAQLDTLRRRKRETKRLVKVVKQAIRFQIQWEKDGRSCRPLVNAGPPATASAAVALQHLSHSETGPPAEPAAAEVALTKAEVEVLTALAERPGQSMLLVDLVEAGGYSKNTTRDCLRRLAEQGMICRPAGQRKGVAITSKGGEFLARSRGGTSVAVAVAQ